MHVALLNPLYWPEVRRGSERFARGLADGLLARGHHVTLITSHKGRPSTRIEDGLRVVRVWRPPDRRLDRRLYEHHLTHLPFAARALDAIDADVAHALYPTDGLVAARWRARTGRPAVLSYMGIPHRQGLANRRLRVQVLQRAIRGASTTVALSEAARSGFDRWLGVDARVIAPGVDLDTFSPDPAARAAAPTILCAADLREPRKRVGLLVDAFALLRAEMPDARLVLSCPPGGEAAACAALEVSMLAPGIELRDLDDLDALVAANRAAWVAALPSVGEAFGLVLVEALACGTPVAASQREALPEIVNSHAVGSLFAGEDPQALAAALRGALALIAYPATAVACRARAADFSTDRMTGAYLALYDELRA